MRVGAGDTGWVASSPLDARVTSVDIKPSPSDIFVYNLESATRIRTGEKGEAAV